MTAALIASLIVLFVCCALLWLCCDAGEKECESIREELQDEVAALEKCDYDLEKQIDELKRKIVEVKDWCGDLDKAWMKAFVSLKEEFDKLKDSTNRPHVLADNVFADLQDLKEKLKEALQ